MPHSPELLRRYSLSLQRLSPTLASTEVVEIRSDARCGVAVGGGGHRPCRLRWSCETSTMAGRGTDDRGEIGAIGAAGEGR
jgi:hypothetical protein